MRATLALCLVCLKPRRAHVDQQEEARTDNRGVHAHECVPAWEWRAQLLRARVSQRAVTADIATCSKRLRYRRP
jgi:hypothetical protein